MNKLNGISVSNSYYERNKTNSTNSINRERKQYIQPKVDIVNLSTSQDIMMTEMIDETPSFFDKIKAFKLKKNLNKDLSKNNQVSEYYDKDDKKLLVKLVPAGTTLKINGKYVKTEKDEAAVLDKDGNMQIVDLTQLTTKTKLKDGTVKITNFDGSFYELLPDGSREDYNSERRHVGGIYKDGRSYTREKIKDGFYVNKVNDGSKDYFKYGELRYTETYDDEGSCTTKYHKYNYGDDFSDDNYDVVTEKKDGTVFIKYKEGHTETRKPDKSRTVKFEDGSVKNFNSANKLVDGITTDGMHYTRTYNEDLTIVDKMEDGSEIHRSKCGSKEFVRTFEKDGSFIDKYSDTHTITHKTDGTTIDKDSYMETTINPDGTKTKKYSNGIIYNFNKEDIVVSGVDIDGRSFTRTYLEDNSFIDKFNDGTEKHYDKNSKLLFNKKTYSDGTVEKKFENGNILKTTPNNETVLITPQKTIPCDKNGVFSDKKNNGMTLNTDGKTGDVVGGVYPDGKKFTRKYTKHGFIDEFEDGTSKKYQLKVTPGETWGTIVRKTEDGCFEYEYRGFDVNFWDSVTVAKLRPDCVSEIYHNGKLMTIKDEITGKKIGGGTIDRLHSEVIGKPYTILAEKFDEDLDELVEYRQFQDGHIEISDKNNYNYTQMKKLNGELKLEKIRPEYKIDPEQEILMNLYDTKEYKGRYFHANLYSKDIKGDFEKWKKSIDEEEYYNERRREYGDALERYDNSGLLNHLFGKKPKAEDYGLEELYPEDGGFMEAMCDGLTKGTYYTSGVGRADLASKYL